MKRRTFILFTLLALLTRSFANNKKADEFKIIKDVYNHLFPTTINYSGASIFGAFDFLTLQRKRDLFSKQKFSKCKNHC